MDKVKAYVASPLNHKDVNGIKANMLACQKYIDQIQGLGYQAFALHNMPIFDDHIEEERTLALKYGLRLLKYCNVLFVCGDTISKGMSGEIERAIELGKKIYVSNWSVYKTLLECKEYKALKGTFIFFKEDALLGENSLKLGGFVHE